MKVVANTNYTQFPLIPQAAAQKEESCFSKIWDVIVRCFKCLFSCFLCSKEDKAPASTPTLSNRMTQASKTKAPEESQCAKLAKEFDEMSKRIDEKMSTFCSDRSVAGLFLDESAKGDDMAASYIVRAYGNRLMNYYSPNLTLRDQLIPLRHACQNAHPQTVKDLMKLYKDRGREDLFVQDNPLSHLCGSWFYPNEDFRRRRLEITKQILSDYPNLINAKSNSDHNETPLEAALSGGVVINSSNTHQVDWPLVQLLLDHDADTSKLQGEHKTRLESYLQGRAQN